MNKLTQDKRNKLLLIGAGTLTLSLVLYFFVITAQQAAIAEHRDKITLAEEQLAKAERWIRQGAILQDHLTSQRQSLDTHQSNMAPLDKFKWFYNTLESFRSRYDVSLVDITREPELGEAGLLPNFPFSAATFGVKLNGPYHEFGRFLADFENSFPYMCVRNLRLELDPSLKLAGTNAVKTAGANLHERLGITLKVVTLVKPTTPL